jgi:hypothetical protein
MIKKVSRERSPHCAAAAAYANRSTASSRGILGAQASARAYIEQRSQTVPPNDINEIENAIGHAQVVVLKRKAKEWDNK